MTKQELIKKIQAYIDNVDHRHNADIQFIYDFASDLKHLDEPKECEFYLINDDEHDACICSNCAWIEDSSGSYARVCIKQNIIFHILMNFINYIFPKEIFIIGNAVLLKILPCN